MKALKNCLFVVVTLLSLSAIAAVQAEDLPQYDLIDLGVFGTDSSEALAVNEKGQVLGRFRDRQCEYTFLWDKASGLKVIDLPEWHSEFLNNNGQIAGTYNHGAFFWDPNFGSFEIGYCGYSIGIKAFNDKGQILGHYYDDRNNETATIFWNKGKVLNLTTLFREEVPGNWDWISGKSLNNHGEVVISAQRKILSINERGACTSITKSYLWKDGVFTMIMPEKGSEIDVNVSCIDDNRNMIAYIGDVGNVFINPSKGVTAALFGHSGQCLIKNGLPIEKGCLPGKIKKNVDGNLYFGPGIGIKKIIKEEAPYCNIKGPKTKINDQNSNGFVVGKMETVYGGYGYHAFLAIPREQNKK